MRRRTISGLVLSAALAAAACSSGTTASPSTASTAPAASSAAPASAASGSAVDIKGFAFAPQTITAKAGDTITWTNDDSVPHTVTLDDNSVDSGDMAQGATFSHAFTQSGTFAYHCKIHPQMKGTVTVG